MEAGADFEQTADPAAQLDLPGGRFGDARQDFQQRGLARTVTADDAECLTGLHLEIDVLQCPECFIARRRWPRSLRSGHFAQFTMLFRSV